MIKHKRSDISANYRIYKLSNFTGSMVEGSSKPDLSGYSLPYKHLPRLSRTGISRCKQIILKWKLPGCGHPTVPQCLYQINTSDKTPLQMWHS